MKLRYYMRGLGIGVIVTAILMGIALGGDKEKLTDAEIMARAKELGMVESSVLADLGKDKEQLPNQNTPSIQEDASKEEESNTDQSQTGESQAGESQASESQAGENQTGESQIGESEGANQSGEPNGDVQTSNGQSGEDEESSTSEGEYITLVIERGESSVSVSRSLEELGLVESAKAFDRYLCDNGYDKSIRVGTHQIKVGSTDEEIAETISRKKK